MVHTFTSYLVLEAFYELCDHSPNDLQLFTLGGRQWIAKGLQLILALLELLFDLVDDFRHVMLDVCE